jgi:dipeptidyl aminopeptidase/acylaminoacyl peptidase
MKLTLAALPSPLVLVLTGLLLSAGIWSQGTLQAQNMEDKRSLQHEDYDKWNDVRSPNLSRDGRWISYVVAPADGDATLKIRHIESAKEFSVLRGDRARFSHDDRFALYVIAPDPEVVKQLKKQKKPDSQIPKSRLEILDLESGKPVTIADVGSFSLPDEAAGWVAFKIIEAKPEETVKESKSGLTATYEITPAGVRRQSATTEKPTKNLKKKPAGEESQQQEKGTGQTSAEKQAEPAATTPKKQDEKKKKEKKNGTTLVLRNLDTNIEQRIPFVVNFRFSEDGQWLAYTTSSDAGPDGSGDGVHVIDLAKGENRQILSGLGNYGQVVFSKDGKQLAFLTDRDDYQADQPAWSMYHWSRGRQEAKKIAEAGSAGIPEGWIIASTSAPLFAENGKRLYFNTRPKPEKEEEPKKANGEEEEKKAKLDIWHWQDPFLQPQQLLLAERERNRSYRAVYDIGQRKVIQIATTDIPDVSVDPRNEADLVVGTAPDKYNKMRSWDIQGFSDWYLIDQKSGKSRLLREMSRGNPSLSPGGRYIAWWDGERQTWLALPTAEAAPGSETLPEPVDLGQGIGQPLYNELHDTPSLPGPYGSGGWLADDKAVLVYDRWDIWQVDPANPADAVCLTAGQGRQQQIRFRMVRLDNEERTVDLQQPRILSSFVHENKSSGYYRMQPVEEGGYQLTPLLQLDESIGGLRKARDSNTVMFTRSTFQRYPDIWVSDLDFQTMRRISDANPQQSEYIWGTAELVRWQADDGQELEGLLYKPESFDPQKKYPLMVYFYERNSDNLHRYYAPAAGRSIINFSFYVSRGYVIFVPDIPYKTGEPGPSAANAVLPGVKHVVSLGYIDEQRIGMQGHSWGGYQTAFLVTVTDMFCCAESGAPVSNMTSAYGGIRWGTGMSRMFQYEKTQSRIGGTLWEARDKYIANSPLFFADRINTPLLILHNDEDTAVPWYQGIELFVALRRLEKPAWMLNYNGDPHWVMSDENRMDFAKRMQQFFDHYMKGDPLPVWMARGIPAVDKGKEFGFEYVEKEAEAGAEETRPEESESADAPAGRQ